MVAKPRASWAGTAASAWSRSATICVKPSQFTDDTAGIGAFCRSLAAKAAALAAPGGQP